MMPKSSLIRFPDPPLASEGQRLKASMEEGGEQCAYHEHRDSMICSVSLSPEDEPREPARIQQNDHPQQWHRPWDESKDRHTGMFRVNELSERKAGFLVEHLEQRGEAKNRSSGRKDVLQRQSFRQPPQGCGEGEDDDALRDVLPVH